MALVAIAALAARAEVSASHEEEPADPETAGVRLGVVGDLCPHGDVGPY
jgi:hypothetical protein